MVGKIFLALVVCGACDHADDSFAGRLEGEWTADYFQTEIYERKTGALWTRDLSGNSVGKTMFDFVEPNHCDVMWYGSDYGTVGYRICDGWAVFPDPFGKYRVRVGADRMIWRSNEIVRGEYERDYTIHFLRVGTEVPEFVKCAYSDERLRKMLLGEWHRKMGMEWYSDSKTKAFVYSGAADATDATVLFRADGTCRWKFENARPQSLEQTFGIKNGILQFGDVTLQYQIGFVGDELRLFYEHTLDDITTYGEQRLVRMK